MDVAAGQNLTAVSNMPCCKRATLDVSQDRTGGVEPLSRYDTAEKVKLERWVFEPTPIMSTYLLAFCVGEFDSVRRKLN